LLGHFCADAVGSAGDDDDVHIVFPVYRVQAKMGVFSGSVR
jgi:hypothetical protein